jgi:hypothetical protein
LRRLSALTAAAAAALLLTSQSVSANEWCTGIPNGILTNHEGTVMVDVPWGQTPSTWISVCNVEKNWKGISPSTCWSWFSQLATATSERKSVVIYYADLTGCANSPIYDAAPAPYYVSIRGQ